MIGSWRIARDQPWTAKGEVGQRLFLCKDTGARGEWELPAALPVESIFAEFKKIFFLYKQV